MAGLSMDMIYQLVSQIVLAVDVTLKTERLEVSAFVTRQLSIGSESIAVEFQPLDCEVKTADLERLEGSTLSLGDVHTTQYSVGKHACLQSHDSMRQD